MVIRALFLVAFGLSLSADAWAQSRREPLSDTARRRAQATNPPRREPYWDGFILKKQGQCAEAVPKLMPLAGRGFGYEEAQVALGQCMIELAGVPRTSGRVPTRDTLFKSNGFRTGLAWIVTAANAGAFTAQAELIGLYAANIGPDEDDQEAAKWTHLYLANPVRLHLGAPINAQNAIDTLRARMSKSDWLAGKERARIWTPKFATPSRRN